MATHASACLGPSLVFVCTGLKCLLHIFKLTINSWYDLKWWEYSTLAKLNQSLARLDEDHFKDNHPPSWEASRIQQLNDSELMSPGSQTVLRMRPARSLPSCYMGWDQDVEKVPSSDGAFLRAPQHSMRCFCCPPSAKPLPGLGSTWAVREESQETGFTTCSVFNSPALQTLPEKYPPATYVSTATKLKVCGVTQKGLN